MRTRQNATRDWLRGLRLVPCLDCGGRFPSYVMDFDHRDPRQKSFPITTARALLKARDELEAEIAKCDIVCANCHSVRTTRAYAEGVLTWGFQLAALPASGADAQRRRERFRELRAAQLDVLDRVRALPCADCAETFAIAAMEFDHVDPTLKSGMISVMAGRVKIGTLLSELAKCDIVCANCHRIRTYARRVMASALSGCGVVVARDPSKIEARVRFPPPALERSIEEPLIEYVA